MSPGAGACAGPARTHKTSSSDQIHSGIRIQGANGSPEELPGGSLHGSWVYSRASCHIFGVLELPRVKIESQRIPKSTPKSSPKSLPNMKRFCLHVYRDFGLHVARFWGPFGVHFGVHFRHVLRCSEMLKSDDSITRNLCFEYHN